MSELSGVDVKSIHKILEAGPYQLGKALPYYLVLFATFVKDAGEVLVVDGKIKAPRWYSFKKLSGLYSAYVALLRDLKYLNEYGKLPESPNR